MKKSKNDRRESAAERIKADIAKYKEKVSQCKSKLAKTKTEEDKASLTAQEHLYERKLRERRETLGNTLANLTPGSAEVKQYVREQQHT